MERHLKPYFMKDRFTPAQNVAILVFLISLVLSFTLRGQCPTNQVILTNQTEIDNFPQNYTPGCPFSGGLTIASSPNLTDPPITNLNSLASVTVLANFLSIGNCPDLTDLTGLDNLTQVNFLSINQCDNLVSLDALSSLVSVNSIELLDCSALTNIDAFANITGMINFNIQDCNGFVNLDGPSTLTSLASFSLNSCSNLESFDFFSGLTSVSNSIFISNCSKLTDLAPLSSVSGRVSASIDLQNLPLLSDLSGLSGITQTGRLIIRNVDGLTTLAGINPFIQGSTFEISLNDNLLDISAFSADYWSGQTLRLTGNPQLTICNSSFLCGVVENVAGSVFISGNAAGCSSAPEILASCPIFVPDDNFEQALIDLGLDSGPLDDYVPALPAAAATELQISNLNIIDLTGIAGFTGLEVLNCSGNQLTVLDLTANGNLLELDCSNNQLVSLNVQNGNNLNIVTANFTTTNNPSLYCITVDELAYAANNWSNIDPQHFFTEDCSLYCALPSGITVTGITPSGADISWTNPNGSQAINWDIYITSNQDVPNETTSPTINGINSTNYTWNGGLPAVDYDVWVRTNCSNSERSAWNGPESFTTFFVCTQPVLNPTTDITNLGATINWAENSVQSDNYDLYFTTLSFTPAANTTPTINDVPGTSYVWTGGTPNTFYRTWIRADCGNGSVSDWYGIEFFRTLLKCGDTYTDNGGPNGNYSNGGADPVTICPDNPGEAVALDFTSFSTRFPGGPIDYMYIFDGSDVTAPFILSEQGDARWCWDREATTPNGLGNLEGVLIDAQNPGGCLTFDWEVNSTFNSPFRSGWVADVLCIEPTNCLPPSNFSVDEVTAEYVTVSWQDDNSPGNSNWDLVFTLTGNAGFVPLEGTIPTVENVTTPTYTYTDLQPSTAYWYWVRSDCNGDNSGTTRWRRGGSFTTPFGGDDCSGAIDITGNLNAGPVNMGSTAPARSSPIAPSFSSCNNFLGWCETTAQKDVWFRVDIPLSNDPLGYLSGSTLGSSFDTQLAIWDNCTGTLISANDDFHGAGNGYTSFTTAAVEPGSTVYIQVDGWNGTSGTVVLDLVYVPLTGPVPNGIPTTTAIYEATGVDGWTHFVNTLSGTVLASIKKQANNNLGNLGITPGYVVEVEASGGVIDLGVQAAAGSACENITTPYVNNDNWWIMRRTWDISPPTQPETPVLVRSYYTTADYEAVAAQLPGEINTHMDLSHYKIISGDESLVSNPCHENISPENYLEFDAGNGNYTYGSFGNYGHYAEFEINSFSGGGGGGGSGAAGALPVTLLSFSGEVLRSTNELVWSTAEEQNAGYFEVQRSQTGRDNWQPIGRVSAAGNSSVVNNYRRSDENPLATAYYRLKMVDFDGRFEFSDLIVLQREEYLTKTLSIYPIPAGDWVQIKLTSPREGLAPLIITDLTGRIIYQKTLTLVTGEQENEIILADLPVGVYLVKVHLPAGELLVSRLVKQ